MSFEVMQTFSDNIAECEKEQVRFNNGDDSHSCRHHVTAQHKRKVRISPNTQPLHLNE